jgi:hypothetical protein
MVARTRLIVTLYLHCWFGFIYIILHFINIMIIIIYIIHIWALCPYKSLLNLCQVWQRLTPNCYKNCYQPIRSSDAPTQSRSLFARSYSCSYLTLAAHHPPRPQLHWRGCNTTVVAAGHGDSRWIWTRRAGGAIVFQALYGKHELWRFVNIIRFLTLQTVPSVLNRFRSFPSASLWHEVQPAPFYR